MDTLAFLELLDRHGRVQQRVRIDRLPFRIGRNYDNDFIVDDRFVSESHIELVANDQGELLVRDSGSDNGLYVCAKNKRIRVKESIVGEESRLVIGHSTIRLRKPTFQVERTQREQFKNAVVSDLLNSKLVATLVFVFALGLVYVSSLVPSYREDGAAKLLIDSLLPTSVGLLLWAGVWTVASAIAFHRNYFPAHLSITSSFVAASSLLSAVELVILYNTQSEIVGVTLQWVIPFLLTIALFYGHLRFTSSKPRKSSMISASVVSALLFGVSLGATTVEEMNFDPDPRYVGTVLPPAFHFREGVLLDELVDGIATLEVNSDD